MNLKIWFLETRPQFLILPVVLSFLGTCIAWYYGPVNIGHAILAFVGLLFAHISVNVLNDYHDFKSGVDLATKRTPFSGGSGMLPESLLKPGQVLRFGITSFIVAAAIGIYFVVVSGWPLLPLLLVGGLCIILYTPVILKRSWPEWSPGLGLGSLPVLGAFFVQANEYTWPVVIASIPSGILVHNLLFLNEFPDVEADQTAHRKTLPITLGKARSSLIYASLTIALYLWIIGWVIAGTLPAFTLLALLTLPFAYKAIRGALKYGEMNQLMPAMMNNVLIVLLTQLFMGIGYILARVV
ncbi:MAG: prenyltransferase [Dehalococcoidia bacterium]|jgi:1,4-dihydroxy-2-naphthoate octaprenyltransferase